MGDTRRYIFLWAGGVIRYDYDNLPDLILKAFDIFLRMECNRHAEAASLRFERVTEKGWAGMALTANGKVIYNPLSICGVENCTGCGGQRCVSMSQLADDKAAVKEVAARLYYYWFFDERNFTVLGYQNGALIEVNGHPAAEMTKELYSLIDTMEQNSGEALEVSEFDTLADFEKGFQRACTPPERKES
jgi:hypothetical protein